MRVYESKTEAEAVALRTRLNRIENMANGIAMELVRREALLQVEEPEGPYLGIVRKIGARSYRYAAVNAAGRWYLTGPMAGKDPMTWVDMLSFLDKDTDRLVVRSLDRGDKVFDSRVTGL